MRDQHPLPDVKFPISKEYWLLYVLLYNESFILD